MPTSDASSQTENPEQNDAGGLDGDPARLAECGLSEDDLAYMQRDWERVVDSVGRNDHAEYADAFIDELTSLQDQGQDCPAGQSLALFLAVANELADSASDSPDYDLYREAANQGNAWLEELGVSADRLAAG